VDALASLEGDFVLDGELVALDPEGRPSFQLLQNSLSQSLSTYYAFDLLNENSQLLVHLSLRRRRVVLETLFAESRDPLRLSPLLQAPTGQILEAVRSSDWKVS
jgi:bifunctional non-homologous end joining protein LigD